MPPPDVDVRLHVSQATASSDDLEDGARVVIKMRCETDDAALRAAAGANASDDDDSATDDSFEREEYRVCALIGGRVETCGLDLVLDEYAEFTVEGACGAHLTGYYMPEYGEGEDEDVDAMYGDDDDDDDDGDSSDEEEMMMGDDDDETTKTSSEDDDSEDDDSEDDDEDSESESESESEPEGVTRKGGVKIVEIDDEDESAQRGEEARGGNQAREDPRTEEASGGGETGIRVEETGDAQARAQEWHGNHQHLCHEEHQREGRRRRQKSGDEVRRKAPER